MDIPNRSSFSSRAKFQLIIWMKEIAVAAVSLARTGLQVYELAWRKDYSPDTSNGWSHMSKTRLNDRRSYLVAMVKKIFN